MDENQFETLSLPRYKAASGVVEGKFSRTRHRDLPTIGNTRDEDEELLDLEDQQGLRNSSHFVWWNMNGFPEKNGAPAPRNEGLLAMEFNVNGPRAPGLSNYVFQTSTSRFLMYVMPIFDPTVWQRIKREDYKVRGLSVQVLAEDAQTGKMSGLRVSAVDGVENVELILRPRRRSRLDIAKIFDKLRGLASEEESTISVRMDDGGWIDLGGSRIKQSVGVVRMDPQGKAVQSASMWAEILNAFQQQKRSILNGLGRRDS